MMIIILAATLILLALMLRHSSGMARDYAALKASGEPDARIQFYRSRLASSALTFGGGGLALLLLAGGANSLLIFPSLFAPAADIARSQSLLGILDWADLPHLVLPLAVGVSLTALYSAFRNGKPDLLIGDIGALLPRTPREAAWGALISLNAGISEELSFRLALPFALTAVTGNAPFAFVVATVIFGLLHRYQGVVGVIFTGLVGALFAVQYLATGSLLLVIVLHAGLNMMAMVFRPLLIRGIEEVRKAVTGKRVDCL